MADSIYNLGSILLILINFNKFKQFILTQTIIYNH